jgi:dCMP deaminase
MKRKIFLYVPVIHGGYVEFLHSHTSKKDPGFLFILSGEIIEKFPKEIRRVDPFVAASMLRVLPFKEIIVVDDFETIDEIAKKEASNFIFANEAVSKSVMKRVSENCISGSTIFMDGIFLQWDSSSVKTEANVYFDRETDDPLHQGFMNKAKSLASKSSDWWRRVGAVLVKDGELIFGACNSHLPSEHTPYINGDPRDFIEAGTFPNIYSSIHAEQDVLMQALRGGVSAKGAHMYVTSFPCVVCAHLIARSGIKKLFFESGYSSLEGQEVLSMSGVEIVKVKVPIV